MRGVRMLGVALGGALVLTSAGCSSLEWDSFIDPSVVGRWERTPTIAPVIERIHMIEDAGGTAFVEYSEIEPEDLIPVISDYRIGNGDEVEVRIRGLFGVDVIEEPIVQMVDSRGNIELPQVGTLQVGGLTELEAVARVKRRLADAQILGEEQSDVAIRVLGRRQQTFNIMGGINGAGTFLIPEPDFRLLDAITVAGGINEAAPYIFIVRQIPLTDEAARGIGGSAPSGGAGEGAGQNPMDPGAGQGEQQGSPDSIIDLIDELSGEGAGDASPSVVRSQPGEGGGAAQPPIPLIDSGENRAPSGQPDGVGSDADWEFVNGRWVRRTGPNRPAAPRDGSGDGRRASDLVTQRVIRVPLKPLLAGAAEYNLVVRPGDLVRVPAPPTGLVYMTGQVSRPGPYTIPSSGTFTLTRAIAAAGGLGAIAIPERVDVIRMIGNDRQAWVRVNLRAIESGTFPDIVLKDSDRINVGTNFWAYPLAVVRNGFRASYGFGFLLDRNFGNDVFGAPPSNNSSN